MKHTYLLWILTLSFGLILAGCREPYRLLIERKDAEQNSSCTALCFAAVTSAATQADETSTDYDLIECEDVDLHGRDMVSCYFMIPE